MKPPAVTRRVPPRRAPTRTAAPVKALRSGVAPPRGVRRAARGDKPFVVALLLVLGLLGVMTLGPVQNLTAATARVEGLEAERNRLRDQVEGLREQRTRLEDPDEVELVAREQLGMVRPGEIPYVVVPGPSPSPTPAAGAPPSAPPAPPWWSAVADAVGHLFEQ